MEVTSERQAVARACRVVAKARGWSVISTHPLNHKRHYTIRFRDNKGKDHRYYVLFKRELFLSFGKIFGTEGAGESLNFELLQTMEHRGIEKLLFVYESGNVYEIDPTEFLWIAEKNQYKRTQKNGEFTASVPITALTRFKEVD